MMATYAQPADRQWYIVGRWQELEGEERANLLRMLAVCVFYGLQLIQHHWLAAPNQVDQGFHRAATALATVGVLVSLAVQLCLRRRFFPAFLKFASTAADLVLVTGVALLGSGAHSPFRVAYFVVIAMATLRFNLSLIWAATLGSMVAYLSLVGATDRTWFDPKHEVAPIEQLVMLTSLALTGIVMGQAVRRTRHIAESYQERQKDFAG